MIKDQSTFSLVIILLILVTLSLDNVWTSLGENCCWSLLGLKGSIRTPDLIITDSFPCSWGKSPYIFSKFNLLNTDMEILLEKQKLK